MDAPRSCGTKSPRFSSADPIAQARALVPLLTEHAHAAEALRRPHDAVIVALAEARLFSLLTPPRCGGRRVPLVDYLETIATLGEGWLSSAWVCSFYAVHAWMVCLFDAAARDEALRDGGLRALGLVAPRGMAQPVAGGFRLRGRWPFGSGAAHADWALVSAVVRHDDEKPPIGARLFLLPRCDFEIHETWDMDGMAATGSHDIAANDAFVPTHRSLDVVQMETGATPGARLYPDDPLYRLPMPPLLAFVAVAPALGALRASLREFRGQARERDRSWALTLCTEAVQSLAEAAGAGAHRHAGPLYRRVRDLRVMRCHVIFEPDSTAEIYGRALFGLDPETLLV